MQLYESITFWHIKIRPASPGLFQPKAECFSFLHMWRTYFINSLNTCAYVLVPGEFSAIVSVKGRNIKAEKIEQFVATKLQKKLTGIFSQEQVDLMVSGVSAVRLLNEKDCIQTTLDIHRIPQKYSIAGDFRAYPFSSYKVLASGTPTQIDRQTVWNWFGGKHQFHNLHQICHVRPTADSVASQLN